MSVEPPRGVGASRPTTWTPTQAAIGPPTPTAARMIAFLLRDIFSCQQLQNWSGRVDSNHRPLDPQSSALTRLRYAPNRRPQGAVDGGRNVVDLSAFARGGLPRPTPSPLDRA